MLWATVQRQNSPGHLLPFPRDVLGLRVRLFRAWVFSLPGARSAAAAARECGVSKLDVCPPWMETTRALLCSNEL